MLDQDEKNETDKEEKKRIKDDLWSFNLFCSDLYMDRTEYRSADQDTSRKRPDQGDRHIIL